MSRCPPRPPRRPAPARADRAASQQALDQTAAWEQLYQTDRAPTGYVRHLYGRDPTDPALYHLVIDSTAVPLDACVATIIAAATRFWAAR